MAFAAEYQRILSRPTARPVSVSTNSSQILCSHFGDDQYEVFKEDCIPPSKTSGRTKKAHAFAQVKYVALCPSEDFGLTQERKENLNIFELRVLRVLVGEIRIFLQNKFSQATQIFNYSGAKIQSWVQSLFLFFRIRERLFENCQHRLHLCPFDLAVEVEVVDSRGAPVLRMYVVFRNIDAQ